MQDNLVYTDSVQYKFDPQDNDPVSLWKMIHQTRDYDHLILFTLS